MRSSVAGLRDCLHSDAEARSRHAAANRAALACGARTLLAYAQAKADDVARFGKAACTHHQTCRAAAAAMTSEDADRSRRKRANIGAGVD